MATDIIMPQLGESTAEGTILKWLVATGAHVEKDQALLEVETDKVALEIPSPESGSLMEILIQEGETVPVGTPIARLAVESSKVVQQPTSNGKKDSEKIISPDSDPHLHLTPAVKHLAKEHGVDLSTIQGTGREGRITIRDVRALIATKEDATEVSANGKDQSVGQDHGSQDTVIPLTSMRQTIAERMMDSRRTAAHVTTVFEVDFSAIEPTRKNLKLTYLPFVVQAVAQALKTYPQVNSSWSESGIVMKSDINIGIAVALDDGLLVPVIRHADQKDVSQLGEDIADLAQRARSKQLIPDEVQGGTFTITNHGSSGSLLGTPIINQPETAILGVGAIQKRPVAINDAIAIRPMAYLSLSFDHRMIDGAMADQFMQKVKQSIESQEW
ncbi:MAG: 2-oxo acid dehydrogenase subunit E2 [Nitrospinae bacterium]|nr:2-oxo acid dehydrogenase subunit E2 [Nitrospinota bacterium]